MANKTVLSKTDFLAWLESSDACGSATDFVRNSKNDDAEDIFNACTNESWLHWLGHRIDDRCLDYTYDEGKGMRKKLPWKKVLQVLGVK